MNLIEKMARRIAKNMGDDFDNAFEDKDDWGKHEGMSGGGYRDVHQPFKGDYMAVAREVVKKTAMQNNAVVDVLKKRGDT